MVEVNNEVDQVQALINKDNFDQKDFQTLLEIIIESLFQPHTGVAKQLSEQFKANLISQYKYIDSTKLSGLENNFNAIAKKVVEKYEGKRFFPICLAGEFRSKGLATSIENIYTDSALSEVIVRGNHYAPVSSIDEVVRQVRERGLKDNIICLFYDIEHYEPLIFLQNICLYLVDLQEKTGEDLSKIMQSVMKGDVSGLGIDLVLIEKKT